MQRTRVRTEAQPSLFEQWNEGSLALACQKLGASRVGSLEPSEKALLEAAAGASLEAASATSLKDAITGLEDPLGDLFCALRSPGTRRSLGATYTPLSIVSQMVEGAGRVATPSRVVDPGCGSARFLVAAGRRFPKAELIGFEIDPLASLLAKAHLASAGFASRSSVVLADFRTAELEPISGKTLFIGNPPYVRHHLLPQEWKEWLATKSSDLGYKASQLAGLHVHFFLATVLKAKAGDFGAYITASEWLEVNYGSLVRDLFLGHLGGTSITVIEPTAKPFPDAATTAAVTSFVAGSTPGTIQLARVNTVDSLGSPKPIRKVKRERLISESRWSHFTRAGREIPAEFVELGELCRVHRGAVTGSNRVWIAGPHSKGIPDEFLFPSVTRARELSLAGLALLDGSALRRVIDLPDDLSEIPIDDRKAVDRFLKFARAEGADQSYIAKNRKAWWTVGLRRPAPILATYMARRAPSFVRNKAEARHINIAHGLYPRETLGEQVLDALTKFLTQSVSVHDGRTYAGGLTKFEPREMERLLVPRPELIRHHV